MATLKAPPTIDHADLDQEIGHTSKWYRQLAWAVGRYLFIIWLTVTLLFVALSILRGNPVSLFLDTRISPEMRATLAERYGYDKSPLERYVLYMGNALQGDFGVSFMYKEPVSKVLLSRIGKSMWLGGCAYFLGMALSLALVFGVHLHPRGWLARLCTTIQDGLLATPSFLVASLLISFLGVRLGWFPIFGSMSLFSETMGPWQRFRDLAYHSVMPVMSLALPLSGQFAAYLHEKITQLESAPFVQSARGRGVSRLRILVNHKLRVIMPSFFQLAGLYLPMLAGGSLVVEAMFGWSGIGLVLFDAVTSRDYPLLIGGSIWTACFVIAGYETADFLRKRWPSAGDLR